MNRRFVRFVGDSSVARLTLGPRPNGSRDGERIRVGQWALSPGGAWQIVSVQNFMPADEAAAQAEYDRLYQLHLYHGWREIPDRQS